MGTLWSRVTSLVGVVGCLVLHLTIHALSAATSGGGFVLESDLGGQDNLSMGDVSN